MLTGNVYPEICIFLLTIFALKTSSEGTTTPPPTSSVVRIKCSTAKRCLPSSSDLFECVTNQSDKPQEGTSNSAKQNWNVKCMRSSESTCELTYRKCDLESNEKTIYCTDITTSKRLTCTKKRRPESTTTASSSSKVSTLGKVIATSSSSALSSAAGTITPTSSSSLTSREATLLTKITSSSLALSSAAEKFILTPSSSWLSSVQKLSSTSSSQIVSLETTLSPTISSSIVSPAPTLSLKPSSSIASSTAVLASSSVPLPSSKISSEKPLSLIPSSSVLSSTVSSLLMPSSAAVEPTPPSSPLPTPAFSSQPSSTSSSSLSNKIQELANDTISEFDSLNITSNNSLQEAANLFENFTTNYQNMTLGEEEPRTESIFKVAVAFEKIVLSCGKYHLRGTNRLKRIPYSHRNMFLLIQKDYKQNESDFYFENHEWQAYINISSGNFADNGSVIVACVYKDLHDLLQTHSNKTRRRVLTRIIMAAMDPIPEELQENVILKFKNLKNDTKEKHCVFWSGLNNSQDGFSKGGCHLVTSQSNSEETVCSCNHLTHFAVLVDYGGGSVHVLSQKDENIPDIITDVGLSFSIICMILTIIMCSLFTDIHQPLTQIRLSLAASLGAGQISFLAGMHAMGNPVVCRTATVLTQYFLMAAFCWMLVEGIYFYFFIVKVYNISNKRIVCHVVAWGFPIILVGISLGVAIGKGGIQSYTSDKCCWLSSTNDLIWIFVLFLTSTAVISSFILTRVTRELTTLPQTGAIQIQRARLGIKTCVVIISFLVITWSFGLLSLLHDTFTYIFTILQSMQGVLIFTLHCVRNRQIMKRLKGKMMTKPIGQIRARLRGRTNVVSSYPNNKISFRKYEVK